MGGSSTSIRRPPCWPSTSSCSSASPSIASISSLLSSPLRSFTHPSSSSSPPQSGDPSPAPLSSCSTRDDFLLDDTPAVPPPSLSSSSLLSSSSFPVAAPAENICSSRSSSFPLFTAPEPGSSSPLPMGALLSLQVSPAATPLAATSEAETGGDVSEILIAGDRDDEPSGLECGLLGKGFRRVSIWLDSQSSRRLCKRRDRRWPVGVCLQRFCLFFFKASLFSSFCRAPFHIHLVSVDFLFLFPLLDLSLAAMARSRRPFRFFRFRHELRTFLSVALRLLLPLAVVVWARAGEMVVAGGGGGDGLANDCRYVTKSLPADPFLAQSMGVWPLSSLALMSALYSSRILAPNVAP
mmetsp:Transcript_19040/g.36862  ORF Transcript_19040/g.36862 Transcript_19040/m.36862 type:complete len:352 (-) Transcript_19040:631-1686(-)